MKRHVVIAFALLMGFAGQAAAEMTPARWASSKNMRMFFDDDVLKAATAEIEGAYRYEVEAMARVIADCDGAQSLPIPPEACSRSLNYFLVVVSKGGRRSPPSDPGDEFGRPGVPSARTRPISMPIRSERSRAG